MPRVSVIIPTHNRAHVVGEALSSVLSQDYRDFEAVVVDDGSSDDTAAVVQSFGEPVRLVRRPCGGPAAARNTGIRESRGEFICFLDSDDLYLPQRLSPVVSFLDRHPEYDAAYGDWATLHEDGRLTRRPGRGFPSGRVFEPLLLRQLWHTNTITLRRRCFDEVGLFDESLPRWEDRDFWLRLAWSCQIAYLPGEVAVYRMERCPEPGRGKRAMDCHWQVALTEKWLASGRPYSRGERRALREALFFSHWEYARQLSRSDLQAEARRALLQAARVAWEDHRWVLAALALGRARAPVLVEPGLWLVRFLRYRWQEAWACAASPGALPLLEDDRR